MVYCVVAVATYQSKQRSKQDLEEYDSALSFISTIEKMLRDLKRPEEAVQTGGLELHYGPAILCLMATLIKVKLQCFVKAVVRKAKVRESAEAKCGTQEGANSDLTSNDLKYTNANSLSDKYGNCIEINGTSASKRSSVRVPGPSYIMKVCQT